MIRLPPRSTLTDTLYTFTTLFLSLAKVPERLSSVLMVALPSRVDAALLGASDRWPVRELAPPPAGSGLKPVLGTAGMPLLGHTLDYIRFGSNFSRARYQRLGPVSWMGAFGTQIVAVARPGRIPEENGRAQLMTPIT